MQYAYTEMAGGRNHSRLTRLTYPNGRVVDYLYGAGINDAISRVTTISDDNGSGSANNAIESYTYLGLGTIVSYDHPQEGENLTYLQQVGDTAANTDGGDRYTGLDRFGRVIDQNWIFLLPAYYGSYTRSQYGYDRDGNVLYRADLWDTALSELYHANSSATGDDASAYDGLGRLTGFARGTLSASGNNGTTLDTVASSSASQSWSLDALGNPVGVTTNGTTVTRGFNALDQVTSTSSGTAPIFDADGNTAGEAGVSYVYDAWNRLVAVVNGATLAAYAYDALGHRLVESYPATATVTHLYYSADWHVIEERSGGTAASDVTYQYVWGEGGNLVVRDSYSGGTIDTLSRLFTMWDANGDVVALTNVIGQIQERYAYSPYGVVTVLNNY